MGRFAILAFAVTAIASSNCYAGGTFRRPEPRPLVTAGVAHSLPSVSMPEITARDLVGGCGRGRVRDPQTHGCRGPADIR
jgi:hypothetical protein